MSDRAASTAPIAPPPTTPTPAARAAEPETTLDPRRWWVLGVLCVSLFVIVVDNTIVNVALPTLVRELGSSISDLQWVVDAYSLVFAGLLLTAGTIGDRYGRKGALAAGLVVFGTASAAAAFAGSVDALIGARAVMGIGAALIMPATLSSLTNTFIDARERALAIGMWAGIAGVAVAAGPVAGGFLLEHFWWGAIFLVNVPVVIVAITVGHFLVPTSRNPVPHPVDWFGAALSAVALVSLVWAIIEAPHQGWTSTPVLAAFGLAAVAAVAFTVREMRTPYPMLNVRFFRNARFTAATLSVMLSFFALIGFVFLATQYLQFVLGYSPLQAGVRTLAFAGAMMIAAPASAKLVERYGTKRIVVIGMLGLTAGLLVASTSTVDSGYPRVALAMVLMGLGTGLVMAPATDSIMGSLPPEHAGVGSAMNDTTREVGAALGVAVIGSVMSSFYTSRVLDALPSGVPAPARAAVGDSVGAASIVASKMGVAGGAIVDVSREAFVYAMARASWVAAAVGLLGALLAWRWLPARAAAVESELDVDLRALDDATPIELAAAYGPIERCDDDPDCIQLTPA